MNSEMPRVLREAADIANGPIGQGIAEPSMLSDHMYDLPLDEQLLVEMDARRKANNIEYVRDMLSASLEDSILGIDGVIVQNIGSRSIDEIVMMTVTKRTLEILSRMSESQEDYYGFFIENVDDGR